MYRILALILILTVILAGCASEPTATPTLPPPSPEPSLAPTEAPTNTVEPTATDIPTVAPTDTPAATATKAPSTGVVKSTLNVRDQPSTRGKLLGVLKKDDTVTLVGRTEDKSWIQINYPIGEQTTAWVIAERITTTASIDALPSVTAAGATTAATQVAALPTSAGATSAAPTASVPATVTVTAKTPVPTTAGGTVTATVTASGTVTATAVATTTVKATAVPTAADTGKPPVTGGTPPGSILFDSFENGGFNIYRVRADGSGLTQLIAGGSEPALSPDGSRIAYRMRRDTGGLGIGIASSTGAYQSTITEESTAGYPTWSADGNNIAYNMVPGGNRSGQIMRIAVGAGNTPVAVANGWRPAWQPNSSVNVLYDGCKGGTDCGSLLTINAYEGDPNNPKLLTVGANGAWSPNSAQIAFQATDDKGLSQIWIVNADGSNRRQVTKDVGTHGMPIWSSDGQWLFYRTDQGGTGWAIYAIRTSGTDARKIVDSNVHPDLWVYAKLAIAP